MMSLAESQLEIRLPYPGSGHKTRLTGRQTLTDLEGDKVVVVFDASIEPPPWPAGTAVGSFRARGVVTDRGICQVDYRCEAGILEIEPTLAGRRGTVTLAIRAAFDSGRPVVGRVGGTWQVAVATADYEGWSARGTCGAVLLFQGGPNAETAPDNPNN